MAIRKGLGSRFVALASLLFLLMSVSAGEEVDRDERRALLLPTDAADLELTTNTVVDVNDDPENAWPFYRNRVRRGFRIPKIKVPVVRMPTGRFNAPSFARSYHTPPKTLPAFPGLTRAKPKTSVQGGGGLRKRWKDEGSKKIYEWDSQHGELEAYSKTGRHLGSYNPNTGAKIKDAVPGRSIEP